LLVTQVRKRPVRKRLRRAVSIKSTFGSKF
jgi:hypothetical protein